jgi:uncharacterized protein DUF6916
MMLDEVTRADFAECVGDNFSLRAGPDAAIEAELISVDALRPSRACSISSTSRESFALVFLVPTKAYLPQGIYQVDHAELGVLDIFLVPIGPDPQRQGVRMEGVFNFNS